MHSTRALILQSQLNKTRRLTKTLLVSNSLMFLGVLFHTLNDHRESQYVDQLSAQSERCIESKMFNPIDYSQTSEPQLRLQSPVPNQK